MATVPKVIIALANGQIGGAVASSDNVVGLMATGTGDGVNMYEPIVVYSLEDAKSKGIDQYDEPNVYRHVKEFYDIAPTGTKLYIMTTAATDPMGDLLDPSEEYYARALLDFADGQIRVLGICRQTPSGYVPSASQFIDSDAIDAMPNAALLVQEYRERIMPLRVLIGANVINEASTTVFNPSAQAKNGVGVVLGSTKPDKQVSMGYILGKVASVPVHRNIGRNRDGALPADKMYIGTVPTDKLASINDLISKGYITFTKYPTVAGFYISDDPMAADSTDDYRILANCRVIDKALVISYQTYVTFLKDDVDIEATGKMSALDIGALEDAITNAIRLAMSDNISGTPTAVINPAQNVLSTSKLKVKLRLTPKGYLKEIEVELGFYNPNKTTA